MKRLLLSILFIGFSSLLIAEGGNSKTTAVKGTITDKFGTPLVGAKVYVESTKQTVYTDFDGEFTLQDIPREEQALKLSHVSFFDKSETIDLSKQKSSFIHLQMKSK